MTFSELYTEEIFQIYMLINEGCVCIVALRHLTHPTNVRENVTELKGKRKDGPPLTSDYITPWKGGRGG